MKKHAFTLVELIVVVTILAILATIGFVTYSGYITGVRDANRIASLTSISDGLELYRTNKRLPVPDDAIEIESGGLPFAYQGYAGKNVLTTISYNKKGLDPKENQYYSYYLTRDKKYFQLMALLEEDLKLSFDNLLSDSSYAANGYANRIPKVYGKKLGILTTIDNIPLQDIPEIKVTKKFNLDTATGTYVANFSDKGKLEALATELGVLKELTTTGGRPNNCLTWLLQSPELKGKEGIFTLTDKYGKTYNGFCDQVSDDGGYTQINTGVVGNNYIKNGDFGDDEINDGHIDTEGGSNNTNTIVDILSPVASGKAIHQTGGTSTEYEIHFPIGTELKKGDIIKMQLWSTGVSGNMFHNRLRYTSGEITNGHIKLLDTKIVDGRTWTLSEVRRKITKDPRIENGGLRNFDWYIGYAAESDRDLYFTGVKLQLFRK